MSADWTHTVPWKLLFQLIPYASLSLCVAAASPDVHKKLEAELAYQIEAEAASFGVSKEGDLLNVAKSVLASWSA